MNLIVHAEGLVTAICEVPDGSSAEDIAFVDSIPPFEPDGNLKGRLIYDGENVCWEYVEPESGISDEEFALMLKEVL